MSIWVIQTILVIAHSSVMRRSQLTSRELNEGRAFGPIKCLNPTTRQYPINAQIPEPTQAAAQNNSGEERDRPHTINPNETLAEALQRKWRSRDNRKGKLHLHHFISTISNN